MSELLAYVEIREEIRRRHGSSGGCCPPDELENICYFIAILGHGTAASAVRNFPPLKQGAVWELLEQVRERHRAEIRLVRTVRDRLIGDGLRRGWTPEAARLIARKALCQGFFQRPCPAKA